MTQYRNLAKACYAWAALLMCFSLDSARAESWSLQPLIAMGCQKYKDFPQIKMAIQREASLNKLGEITMKNLKSANALGAPNGNNQGQRGSLCKAAMASFEGVSKELDPAQSAFSKSREGIRLLNADKKDDCSKALEKRNTKVLYYGLRDKFGTDCPGLGIQGGGYSGSISPPTP
jgi:hypothetical protein